MPADLDIDRLVKIIGMFGSAHEGERANAAAMATKILHAAGLNWEQFFDVLMQPAPAPTPKPASPPPRWRPPPDILTHAEAAELCLCRRSSLTLNSWEREFLANVQNFRRLSDKQSEILRRICRKCSVRWP